jgi:NAD(P)-dependent dehydrogenase (short-subunit alcohol dehydrogenase family)
MQALRDRIAIVTGASRGAGRGIAGRVIPPFEIA